MSYKALKNILELSKVKITVAVSLTTITGYVLGRGKFDWGFVAVTVGIFFLACASSVLNHIQESAMDAQMKRTRNRPIPLGSVGIKQAAVLALTETVAGITILFIWAESYALILGLLAMIWYNGIYTYLKRITPHAVIPGSLIGAIPPLAGWVESGASLLDYRAWAMALFFFVWQVPHFYLLILKYGPEYEKAGFPSLTSIHSNTTIRLMIFLWVVATAFFALSLYYFGVISSVVTMILVIVMSLWLIIAFMLPLIINRKEFNPFKFFMRINYYVLVIIIVLNLDHLFQKYFA
ncbi:MAG: protoheme IX farnesyltransferase [Bacteroidales bacterium]|nr:protoheme IX farnesyltransferase [Bacteroidales bacterium]